MTAARLSTTGTVATAHDARAAVVAERAAFGTLPDGAAVEMVTLTAGNGVRARIMTLGAALQALLAPDRAGEVADITLGYDDAASYVLHPNYWGQTIGRYANRIAGGRFDLDGRTYRLPCNDGDNMLHGGPAGFDTRLWRIVSVEEGAGDASVTMAITSPDGDQGFPGTLDVTVTYTLDDLGALAIDFVATSDAATIVNLTNHAVFNLAGEGAAGIGGHRMTIPARRFLPVTPALIPTGELRAVAGTPFDFTAMRSLSDGIRDGRDPQIAIGRGWDHNFVLDKGATAEPELAARVEEPVSGRVLEVLTTEPGIQFYSGNFLDGSAAGKQGHLYRMGDGFALEPQKFPDTPNQPAFGSARVEPGRPYHHRMIYRVSTAR